MSTRGPYADPRTVVMYLSYSETEFLLIGLERQQAKMIASSLTLLTYMQLATLCQCVVFQIHLFSSQRCVDFRERTIIRSVSYRNRYWVYRIESYRLLLYRPILHASLQVHQLLTDRITHDDQRAFKRPVTCPPRMHACVLFYMVHDTGEGWRGGRRKETVTIPVTQRPRSTGPGHHHAAHPPPAGSDNNSQLSIALTFLQFNQS